MSDIDIAVYCAENIDADKRFDLRLKLIAQLSRLLHTDDLDLIILNDSPPALQYSVIYEGIIIYEGRRLERIQFEAKTMSLFFDRQYYEKRHTDINLGNIAREGIL